MLGGSAARRLGGSNCLACGPPDVLIGYRRIDPAGIVKSWQATTIVVFSASGVTIVDPAASRTASHGNAHAVDT